MKELVRLKVESNTFMEACFAGDYSLFLRACNSAFKEIMREYQGIESIVAD